MSFHLTAPNQFIVAQSSSAPATPRDAAAAVSPPKRFPRTAPADPGPWRFDAAARVLEPVLDRLREAEHASARSVLEVLRGRVGMALAAEIITATVATFATQQAAAPGREDRGSLAALAAGAAARRERRTDSRNKLPFEKIEFGNCVSHRIASHRSPFCPTSI